MGHKTTPFRSSYLLSSPFWSTSFTVTRPLSFLRVLYRPTHLFLTFRSQGPSPPSDTFPDLSGGSQVLTRSLTFMKSYRPPTESPTPCVRPFPGNWFTGPCPGFTGEFGTIPHTRNPLPLDNVYSRPFTV